MRWMLRNSDGKKDGMFTLAVAAGVSVIGKFLLAGAALTFGGNTYSAGTLDPNCIGALLTPTLGAYVVRRHTDRNAPERPDSDCK